MSLRYFPEGRGVVLGVLKGYVGLSGAIFTQLYLAIYGGDDAKSLVLLVAWLPAAVSVMFVHVIRIMPVLSTRRRGGGGDVDAFFCFLYISVALASYILVTIVVQRRISFSYAAYAVSVAALLIILIVPLLAAVVKKEYRIKKELKESLCETPTVTVETPAVSQEETAETPESTRPSPPPSSCLKHMFNPPAKGEDYSILQALNMGQIGQSLGYPADSVNTFVSLISIWNYAGRVAAGLASESLLSRYGFPRPLLLTAVLLASCTGHLLIALAVPGLLYAASVIVGVCFGAQWPLLYAIISELFGLSPLGSYVLNVRVAGKLYEAEAARQHGGTLAAAGDKTCMGVGCFREAFLVVTAVTVAGALVSLVLVWRTRDFYKGDIYAKFRGAAADDSVISGLTAGKRREKER